MGYVLYKVLMWLFAFNVFALGILVIFLYNARLNLKRQILEQRFHMRAYNFAQDATTSEAAAERLGVSVESFKKFCQVKDLEIPENRLARVKEEKDTAVAEEKRILEEEAAWRREQERIIEERRKSQEDEAAERKERLKKFGFK